jgi:hypothetical protein
LKTQIKEYGISTKGISILTRNLDAKEKIFDLLSDIRVGLGSELKFKSWDFGLQQISNFRKLSTLF